MLALPFLWIYLLASWWLGMAANSITGFVLNKRGWQEAKYIEAPDMETAEQIFFSSMQQKPIKTSLTNGNALI